LTKPRPTRPLAQTACGSAVDGQGAVCAPARSP
jgi:hypothetical protein